MRIAAASPTAVARPAPPPAAAPARAPAPTADRFTGPGPAVAGAGMANPLTAAPPATSAGQLRGVGGRVEPFVGGNYTDLGMVGGVFDAAEAQRDLERLRAAGVTSVRVWATNLPGLTDARGAANRIGILATQAKALGMTLTVDLFDANSLGGAAGATAYRANDPALDELISTVVGQNAGHDNVMWSLGNELADPTHPADFAAWYTEKAAAVRRAGGPGTRICAELLPGSVNHPFKDPAYAAAARQIIAASDVVSVHYYPDAPYPQAASTDEYRSLAAWNTLTRAAGKPFVVGEFGVGESLRSPEVVRGWLQHFYALGVDQVRPWQFLKDEAGHLDPYSMDLVLGGHDLRAAFGDFFGIPPLHDGR